MSPFAPNAAISIVLMKHELISEYTVTQVISSDCLQVLIVTQFLVLIMHVLPLGLVAMLTGVAMVNRNRITFNVI